MNRQTLAAWIGEHPYIAAVAAVLAIAAVAVLARLAWRTARTASQRATAPVAVRVAAVAAVACTAYSGDTSWRFAEHWLDMASVNERAVMFAAGELALFANALMARHNLRTAGAPGTPGLIVWGVTAVQVFAAYAEGGIVGGTVRAVLGPILAALLWHLAMGIELRHAKPEAASQSLPAVLLREARERLLSRLGLATRGRDAQQITRDRWTARAVDLAARLAEMDDTKRGGWRGRRISRRLSVAVGRALAGADASQREMLLDLLAARRYAPALATIALPSPWDAQPAHSDAPRDALAPAPAVECAPALDAQPQPGTAEGFTAHATEALALAATADTAPPAPRPVAHPAALASAFAAGQTRNAVHQLITPQSDAQLWEDALGINAIALAKTGRPASLRSLQTGLGIGQKRAQRIQAALPKRPA